MSMIDPETPILIVFSGLPGTGKTAIARQLASQLGATYVRIDTIEQALRASMGLGDDVGVAGYAVAYEISEANLTPGRSVVSDSVNPLAITRDAWRDVAQRSNAAIIEVEVICSDATEHRRRVESRSSDIPGLVQPTWEAIDNRDYEPWQRSVLRIDTAQMRENEAINLIMQAVENVRRSIR
jgi:predicted kinase